MIASKRELWSTFFWMLGHAAERKQREERELARLAAVIRFPFRPRVCTKSDFVEPKKGEKKFCANCNKTIHAHPTFVNVSCSQCGETFGPGNHGYSDCVEHRRNDKGAA